MSWTALLPLKARAERKSRLAGMLDAEQRARLSDDMARHVLAILRGTHDVDAIHVLSPVPLLDALWMRDLGRGLNAELTAARETLGAGNLLVLSGDLPFLAAADVATLLSEAESDGIAVAADRKDLGTNGVAIAGAWAFRFAFGPGSLAAHERQRARVVRSPGLAFDVDDADDLEEATRLAATMSEHHELPAFFSLARKRLSGRAANPPGS